MFLVWLGFLMYILGYKNSFKEVIYWGIMENTLIKYLCRNEEERKKLEEDSKNFINNFEVYFKGI